MPFDLVHAGDLVLRLVLAAAFGAAVGLEREIHGHPAGMRTHLLVALGSALFTEMSIFGFGPGTPEAPVDPSRVAAQIVSGIGFLGAGAIIKEGLSVRGLTTAASLWATAAIGLACGAGLPFLAIAGTVIVIFSLWPLNRIASRLHRMEKRVTQLRVELRRLEALTQVIRVLVGYRLEVVGLQTQRLGKGRYDVEVNVSVSPTSNLVAALEEIGRIEAAVLVSSDDSDPG